ncbi:unnamed protein product, partial [Didymodactylos carnosus]
MCEAVSLNDTEIKAHADGTLSSSVESELSSSTPTLLTGTGDIYS